MNIEELKALFEEDVSFEQIEELVSDDVFAGASKLGIDYAEKHGFESFEDAPFCLEQVTPGTVSVVVDDGVKPVVELMKKLAKEQSDTSDKKADHYEASFCLYGRMQDGKIVITDGFWDERGYQPNAYKYADPDSLNYGGFFADYSNVTTTSRWYDRKVDAVCDSATPDGSLVVIYGHTHPQTKELGKVNNYPSRTDVSLAVEEAVTRYTQANGSCSFLNAIINADGDLNIFGFDVETGKFFILDDVKYKSGKKIEAYTEENYPIQVGPTGPSSK